ncbi:MAG: M1 family metallopeptidase [Candidatus Obscuribacterales bacterium]|nr:M1 family metallopeptidase [Candidatus Obscuribacterales bacterium]
MCQRHKQLEKGPSRLSSAVKPSFYKLKVIPDIEGATFSGQETISLTLEEAQSRIVLNSTEIVIKKALLSNKKGSSFNGKVSYDEEKQLAIIELDGQAGKGEWQLELAFEGILNNKLRGFYRSSYKDGSGVQKHIATTKFEPSDARRAFPCFDEPEFKAQFQITIEIDKELTAISNSPLQSEKDLGNGKKLLEFKPSIKMSSYLVAYVVGEFEASEIVPAKSGAPIRVWSVPGKKHLSAYALKWAKFSLDYFAEYFGIDYPGEKLDLVAIPDFASGAMENFGCITFRETALLLDESRATHSELLRVAEVVSHENAHMWFGDLVTMNWWNGLWLNEAFATFMAAKAVHAFMPEWKFWESFNIEKAGAMRIDGLNASRSIEFPVQSPEDARAMFDVLTYEKGCAILRMLELYLGEEVFRRGCAIYMARHQYANTETADLWLALDQAVKEAEQVIPVSKMMDSWVYQQGFPLVTVAKADAGGSIVLKQHPFRYLPSAEKHAELWHLPVALRAQTSDGTVERYFLLEEAEQSFYVGEGLQGLVVNAEGKGFFRVSYSEALRQELLAGLNKLSSAERFNLTSDLWAATQAGAIA